MKVNEFDDAMEKMGEVSIYEEFAEASLKVLSLVHNKEELDKATEAVFFAKNRLMRQSENFNQKICNIAKKSQKYGLKKRTDLFPVYASMKEKWTDFPDWVSQFVDIDNEKTE